MNAASTFVNAFGDPSKGQRTFKTSSDCFSLKFSIKTVEHKIGTGLKSPSEPWRSGWSANANQKFWNLCIQNDAKKVFFLNPYKANLYSLYGSHIMLQHSTFIHITLGSLFLNFALSRLTILLFRFDLHFGQVSSHVEMILSVVIFCAMLHKRRILASLVGTRVHLCVTKTKEMSITSFELERKTHIVNFFGDLLFLELLRIFSGSSCFSEIRLRFLEVTRTFGFGVETASCLMVTGVRLRRDLRRPLTFEASSFSAAGQSTNRRSVEFFK